MQTYQHPVSGETWAIGTAPDGRRVLLGPCEVRDGIVRDPLTGLVLDDEAVAHWAANLGTKALNAAAKYYSRLLWGL